MRVQLLGTVFGLGAMVSACGAGINVSSDWDPAADFSQYQTFAVLDEAVRVEPRLEDAQSGVAGWRPIIDGVETSRERWDGTWSDGTYQLSVRSDGWNVDDHVNYSHALARRLPAEVLYDALHGATGSRRRLPGQRAGTSAVGLADPRIETRDGHGAGKPPSKRIEEAADQWAFLVKNLGMPSARE